MSTALILTGVLTLINSVILALNTIFMLEINKTVDRIELHILELLLRNGKDEVKND